MKSIFYLSICFVVCCICACNLAQSNENKNQPTNNTNSEINQLSSVESFQNNRQTSIQPDYNTKKVYVPDEQTAIAIAVAVWIPIYGKEHIEGEKPYTAKLKNGVWTVKGSLPEGADGGVAEADIAQDNGKILRVIHGQ